MLNEHYLLLTSSVDSNTFRAVKESGVGPTATVKASSPAGITSGMSSTVISDFYTNFCPHSREEVCDMFSFLRNNGNLSIGG